MTDLRHAIRLARELRAGEFFRRARGVVTRLAADRVQRLRARIAGTTLSDRAFLQCMADPSLRSRDALPRHFRSRERPIHFVPAAGPESGMRAQLIAGADKACGHVFDLLGSGDTRVGDAIEWHVDFKTGYRWDHRTWYRDITIPYGKADIKVPWELSRFSHAVTLGQAYRLTGDEKYAREFVGQIHSWIASNKPGFGANWACTMDVAVRACNWTLGFALLRGSQSLTDDFLRSFAKSLYQHGLHIRSNLEYSEALTSNHYLSNVAGLVYLGVLFPEFREGAGWREFGVRELVREMEKQVYPDGCDFEASTCYHRLALELFFYSTLIVVVNDGAFTGDNHREVAGKIFGGRYTDRLYAMFDAVLALLKPDGRMPQLGDNDSGRLHVFAPRDVLDMRYLLALGAVFFHEPRFMLAEFGVSEEAHWVLGDRGRKIGEGLREHSVPDIESRAFPDAGWYVMRSGRDHLVVSCGPNGQKGNGGHAHNDKLSFELSLGGADVVVDPGTYLYTRDPAARNLFRSTRMHNTVVVNGLEQARLDGGNAGLFRLPPAAPPAVLSRETAEESDRLIAEFAGPGYNDVVHRRTFELRKNEGSALVVDELRVGAARSGLASFHLPPGVTPEKAGMGIVRAGCTTFSFTGAESIAFEPYPYSREYGVKEPAWSIAVRFSDTLATEIRKEHV